MAAQRRNQASESSVTRRTASAASVEADAGAAAAPDPKSITLRITRTFDAPRDLVWKAWTEREHLMRWYCPTDFTALFAECDVRPGGTWRSGMRGPDGKEYIHHGVYRELDPPERLVFTHAWERDDEEQPCQTTFESVVTVTLTERDGKTEMVFDQVGFVSTESRDSHETGWTETFEKLGRHLEQDASTTAVSPVETTTTERDILLRRVFKAPRDLLWRAYTEAEHIEKWFGPRGFSTRVEAHDFRVGGKWRYVMIGPDGAEYPSEGVFQEIVPGERYVSTDEFGEGFDLPGMPDLPTGIVTTIVFEDVPGGTRMTVRIAHPTEEDRRKHEAMGVVEGFASMLDCLDEHLASMNDNAEDREILISRVLNAPRALVWEAWTDPEQIVKWWGPNGFSTTTRSIEVKPGGEWWFTMHGPDGRDYPNRIRFVEIVRPERLVYLHDDGEEVEPINFHTTVTFDEVAGDPQQTKVTLRMVFPSTGERDHVVREYGAVEGGIEHVDRLAEHLATSERGVRRTLTLALPNGREVMVSRKFPAPRQLVFDAMTRPEMVKRWMYGPDEWPLVECHIDLRVGGKLRYVWRHREQGEMGMSGVFREIVPPERLVHTELFDQDWTGGETLVTTVLTEENGETRLISTVRYSSQQARDAALKTGMLEGWGQGHDRLDEMLLAGSEA